MKTLCCPRCGGPWFFLYDMGDSAVEAKCIHCDLVIKLRRVEEEHE